MSEKKEYESECRKHEVEILQYRNSWLVLFASLSFCSHHLRSPCNQQLAIRLANSTDSWHAGWPVNRNKQHKLLAKQSLASINGLKLTNNQPAKADLAPVENWI